MKKKVTIPDDYFNDQEFITDSLDEKLISGILGPRPSPDQVLKFELCSSITHFINKNQMSLSAVEKITGINPSDISRIKNHHLDRFTIDRLVKIYCSLDNKKNVGLVLKMIGEKISKTA